MSNSRHAQSSGVRGSVRAANCLSSAICLRPVSASLSCTKVGFVQFMPSFQFWHIFYNTHIFFNLRAFLIVSGQRRFRKECGCVIGVCLWDSISAESRKLIHGKEVPIYLFGCQVPRGFFFFHQSKVTWLILTSAITFYPAKYPCNWSLNIAFLIISCLQLLGSSY